MRDIRPWKVLHSEYLIQRRWLNVRQDRVQTGRGYTIDEFHVLEIPSWACICCFSKQGELILTRQYRHGVRRVTLELPAGVLEPNETPLEGAKRELFEETGYASEDWTLLTTLRPEPSRHTHLAYCFVARGAEYHRDQQLDDEEDLVVEPVPIARVMPLIETGQLDHAVHVAALLLAHQRGLFPG